MKCQNCGENEANVKYTQIINGNKKQMNLCDKCAKEIGIDEINFSMPISLSSFLTDSFNMIEDIPFIESKKILTCPTCKMTYEEFLKDGKFGCEDCYDTFSIKLNSLFKNIHGNNRHVGRIEQKMSKKIDDNVEDNNIKNNGDQIDKIQENKTELSKLKEQLKREIKEERYEDAAKTRDEIKKIENK